MAFEEAKQHLKKWNKDKDIQEFAQSSATVELAAERLGVEPARIAKTLSFKDGEGALLIVTAGDTKTDNAKFKAEFDFKPRMLSPEDTLKFTGHSVGGVCPFGLKTPVPVYLDISLKRFETVFPACGSSNSAVEMTGDELQEYSGGIKWVDVCKGWANETGVDLI